MFLNNRANGSTGTFFNTLVTVRTRGFIFNDSINTHLFKKPGYKTCRAEKVAEWPVVEETCQDKDCCNNDDIRV